MKQVRHTLILFTMVLAITILPTGAFALNILLTNDDSWVKAGELNGYPYEVPMPVQAVYAALLQAGHTVTCVVPAENQSGKGGSLNTDVGGTVSFTRNEAGAYLVESTPTDCVRAAIGVLGVQPDLIIAGPNFGQNIGKQTSCASGTVNAALLGAQQGIPSIAVSLGIRMEEYETGMQSTFAAYQPTAAFVVKLVATLEANAFCGGLLPHGTLLNVNVPVPYENIQGIASTHLATNSALDAVWVPAGPNTAMILTKVQTGGVPAEEGSDQAAFDAMDISITVMDPDMTANIFANFIVGNMLEGLQP